MPPCQAERRILGACVVCQRSLWYRCSRSVVDVVFVGQQWVCLPLVVG